MGPKRRRRGVGGAPLTPIHYINVNFPPSEAALYEAIKREAKRRRQGASQYLRYLAAEELGMAEPTKEASDGSAD